VSDPIFFVGVGLGYRSFGALAAVSQLPNLQSLVPPSAQPHLFAALTSKCLPRGVGGAGGEDCSPHALLTSTNPDGTVVDEAPQGWREGGLEEARVEWLRAVVALVSAGAPAPPWDLHTPQVGSKLSTSPPLLPHLSSTASACRGRGGCGGWGGGDC
jgi:hypothetical protein